MIKIRKILLDKGFDLKVDGSKNLFATHFKYTISVDRDYKGYKVELVEWLNSSIGRKTELNTTKSKEIIKLIEKLSI